MAGLPTHWEDVYVAPDPEVSGNRRGVGVCANAQRCPWERSRVGETAASICEANRASRCENTEKRWHLELCRVGSTDTTATLAELVLEYDQRSGTPESSFCQDYQALSLRKYRKFYRTASFALAGATLT